MNKYEFLGVLKKCLSVLPEEDIKKSIDYYSEMIDDRIEDGLSECEAIKAIGHPEDVAMQILNDSAKPEQNAFKIKIKRKLSVTEILLIVLGSPIWILLLAAAASVIIAVYATVISVIAAIYCLAIALLLGAVICIAGSVYYISCSRIAEGIFIIGSALLMMGISILLFMLANIAVMGFIKLNRLIFNKLFKKEEKINA